MESEKLRRVIICKRNIFFSDFWNGNVLYYYWTTSFVFNVVSRVHSWWLLFFFSVKTGYSEHLYKNLRLLSLDFILLLLQSLVYLLLFLILWVHTCGCRYPCLWCHLLILQFFFFFWYFCLGLWTRMLISSAVGQQAPGVLLYPTFSTRITHTTTMPNYLVGFWASKLRFPYLKDKYSTHWAIPSAGIYVKIHFANYKIHLSILGDSVIYYIHNIVL